MNLLPGDAAYTCSKEMLAAVGALVEMQGIVRMMQQISSRVVSEQRDKVGILKKVDIPNLVEMQGIVRMMQHICSGVVFEQRDPGGF